MVVVELRNNTVCPQEIPVIHQGEEMYVDPLSLVNRRSATPVKCRKRAPPLMEDRKRMVLRIP